ncbi:MAG: GNAT family N-acetyltransferase [Ardenticatenales bacterium]
MTGLGAAQRLDRGPDGLLRFELSRDLAPAIDLLEIGFGDDLEARDRRWLKDLAALSSAGPLMSLLLHAIPGAIEGLGGFVCYDNGRLIGNASLLRAGLDTWVIANVVTHPNYRRQGIAGRLMHSALETARTRGARRIQLQVRDTNDAAKKLYVDLGFRTVGATTLLRLPSGIDGIGPDIRAAAASAAAEDFSATPDLRVVPWRRSAEGRATRLLVRAGEAVRASPPSIVRQTARRGALKGRVDDWLHSRTRHRLAVVAQGDHRALGVVDAYSYGGPHRIDIVVDPSWRGHVERALVAACIERLADAPPQDVEADAPGRDGPLSAVLEAVGFVPVRTLERLELWLG